MSERTNPFEPVYVPGSDYDPMNDAEDREMERYYNSLDDDEKDQWDSDSESWGDD